MGDTEGDITIPQWLARALAPLAIIGTVGLGLSLRDSVLDHERRVETLEQRAARIQEADRIIEQQLSVVQRKLSNLSTRLDYTERRGRSEHYPVK